MTHPVPTFWMSGAVRLPVWLVTEVRPVPSAFMTNMRYAPSGSVDPDAVNRIFPLAIAETSITGGAVTVTVADPEIEPLLAATVFVKVPAVEPAVNSPVLEMDPPLAVTPHVGVNAKALPLASFPAALNC